MQRNFKKKIIEQNRRSVIQKRRQTHTQNKDNATEKQIKMQNRDEMGRKFSSAAQQAGKSRKQQHKEGEYKLK